MLIEIRFEISINDTLIHNPPNFKVLSMIVSRKSTSEKRNNSLIINRNVKQTSPLRKKKNDLLDNQKEGTINSRLSNKDYNYSMNKGHNRSVSPKLMEYHKFSNIDLPKEKIHGNANPEHFFGHQLNVRRKSSQPQSSAANLKVINVEYKV